MIDIDLRPIFILAIIGAITVSLGLGVILFFIAKALLFTYWWH